MINTLSTLIALYSFILLAPMTSMAGVDWYQRAEFLHNSKLTDFVDFHGEGDNCSELTLKIGSRLPNPSSYDQRRIYLCKDEGDDCEIKRHTYLKRRGSFSNQLLHTTTTNLEPVYKRDLKGTNQHLYFEAESVLISTDWGVRYSRSELYLGFQVTDEGRELVEVRMADKYKSNKKREVHCVKSGFQSIYEKDLQEEQ